MDHIGSTIVAAALLVAGAVPAPAETAILECTADALISRGAVNTRAREMRLPGMVLVSFRTWNVTRWSVENATLFLHIVRGEAPLQVELAAIPQKWGEIEPPRLDAASLKWVSQRAQLEPENWVAINVPGSIVEEMASSRAHGLVIRFKGKDLLLHARESVSYSPYLIVSGTGR